jgi:hypothetical protein
MTPLYIKESFDALSATENNFGVDKLLLFTSDYAINDKTPWNIHPNTKKAGETEPKPTLITTIKNEPIYGSKFYVNKEMYSAEINHGYMRVQFNPSKIYDESNLTFDRSKIADALTEIQSDMNNTMSTDIDLFSTNISRLDIAAQAQMNNPVPYYDQIIRAAQNLKRAPKTEYPNGFNIGKGQRQVGTYDKGFKLQLDKGYKNIQASNFLRVEPRFLNAKAVQANTPFKSINDLLSANDNLFRFAYSKTLNDLLKVDQTQIEFLELSSLTNLIEVSKKTYNRQWLNFLIITLQAAGAKLPTATQFEQALIPLVNSGTIHRSVISRSIKKYQAVIHQSKILNAAYLKQSETNYIDQHSEFIDKFFNPYKVA